MGYSDYWDLTDQEILAWHRAHSKIIEEREQARKNTSKSGFV